ncbi:MAG: hypothetical protein PHS59_05270 [Paludibacter sp.]|nr:hypothetical protein [Paludibacter sp.]
MDNQLIDRTQKTLSGIYYIVYTMAVLFAVAGYYLTVKGNLFVNPQSELGITLTSIFIIYIIGSIPLTLGGFHYMTKKWIALENEVEKIEKYKNGAILRLIIVGISIGIGVFLFYVTRSQSMIFCAGIAAIALFFCKPMRAKIISELKLEEEEL